MLGPENPPVVIGLRLVRDDNCTVPDLKKRRFVVADHRAQYGTGKFSGAQIVGVCSIPDLGANSRQPILDKLLGDPIETRVANCLAKFPEEPADRQGCPIEGSSGTTRTVTRDSKQDMPTFRVGDDAAAPCILERQPGLLVRCPENRGVSSPPLDIRHLPSLMDRSDWSEAPWCRELSGTLHRAN